MASYNELLVSARDAEALAAVVGDRRRTDRFEADAADALAGVLMDAQMVPHDRLPEDRVAMNSRVAYQEEPGGARRRVAVVHPSKADPADGRISVLSPVGRALLGRQVRCRCFDRHSWRPAAHDSRARGRARALSGGSVMNKPDYAIGAALAGTLLIALPVLDLVLGGEGAAAVRAVVGSCGVALLAVYAARNVGKEGL